MTQTDMGLPLEGRCAWCRVQATCKHQGSLCCRACAATDSKGRIVAWLRMFDGLRRAA